MSSVELDTRILDALIAETPAQLEQFGRAVAESMTGDIKGSFNTSPPGREYYRGGVIHIASQPGFPPNTDTGALVNSIHWVPDGHLRWLIADGVAHGLVMEEGSSTVDPRPFMQPVFRSWEKGKFVQLATSYNLIRGHK